MSTKISTMEVLASGEPLPPRDTDNKTGGYKVKQKNIEIPENVMQDAFDHINKTGFVKKWPAVERFVTDPVFEQQKYCLHSFVPAAGAKPDKDGVFGFFKCRGTYPTVDSMNQRAESIIREVDSYHDLFHGIVGAPLPFTLNPEYCEKTKEIDIRDKAIKTVSDSVAESRENDRRVMKELKQRELELINDTAMVHDKEKMGPRPMTDTEVAEKKLSVEEVEEKKLDDYIATRVKRASYLFTLVETKKKTDKIKKNLKSVEEALLKIDTTDPTLIKRYKEKYDRERDRVGLSDDHGFINYLSGDLPEGLL